MTTMDVSGAERYNPEKLGELEKFIDQQVAGGSYSLDANLALLRLYQFQPERVNMSKLLRVLIKALMQLPAHDFQTCLFMVSDHIQAQEPVAELVNMASHLTSCRFRDFWACAEANRELFNSIPGFYDAVRSYAMHVLGSTFQRVSKSTLTEVLKLEGQTLDALIDSKCKTAGWTVAPDTGGSVLILPKTDDNQPKVQTTEETKYDGIGKVLTMRLKA